MVNLSLVGQPRLLADDAGSEKSETEPSEAGTAKQKGTVATSKEPQFSQIDI